MPKASNDNRHLLRFFKSLVVGGLRQLLGTASWIWNLIARRASITLQGLAVFSILVLISPFVFWETVRYPSFTVMPISVSTDLAGLGYTPDVVARHLIDSIIATGSADDPAFSKIQQKFSELGPVLPAKFQSEYFDVNRVNNPFNVQLRDTVSESDIVLPGIGLSIRSLARYLNFRFHPWRTRATVSGELFYEQLNKSLLLRLRINDEKMEDIVISGTANHSTMIQLFQEGAHTIIKKLDFSIADGREARIHMLKLQGALYVGDEHLETALTKFAQALEFDPKDVETHRLLGAVLARKGDHDAAIATYRNVIELDDGDALGYRLLGAVLARFAENATDYNNAIDTLRQAIELDRDNAETHRLLGQVLMKCSPNEGIKEIQKAIKLDPEDPKAYYRLGVHEARFANHDEAVVQFKKAIEFDPEYVSAYISLGFVLANRDRNASAAIAQFKKALELDPQDAKVYRFWGYMLTRFEENTETNAEAIEKYKKAIELDPEDARSYRSWGDLLEKEGDLAGAAAKRAKAGAINAKRGRLDLPSSDLCV